MIPLDFFILQKPIKPLFHCMAIFSIIILRIEQFSNYTLKKRGEHVVKLEDIAKILNVSKSTVSRALNDIDVSEKTKQEVKRVAQKLGYEQNTVATSLANKKQKVVKAFLTTSIVEGYADALEKGIKRLLQDKKSYKFQIDICLTDRKAHDEPQKAQWEQLNAHITDDIDGVILRALSKENIALAQRLCKERDIPLMTLDMDYDLQGICHVGPNYCKAGKISANLMGGLMRYTGCILIIAFDEGNGLASSKIKGFEEIIGSYPKMSVIKKHVHSIDYNSYESCIQEALKSNSDISGIYAPYNTEYVAEVLLKMEIHDKIIIANDRSEAVNAYVKKGCIEAIVHQKPFYQGFTIGNCFFRYFYNKQEFKEGCIDTGIDILFKESLYWIESRVGHV